MAKALKVSNELAEAASKEASLMSRSLTKQIEHWAQLGRRLECSGLFSYPQMRSFLDGDIEFDALTGLEQAVATEAMMEDLESFEPSEDFLKELRSGIGSSGVDSTGNIVRTKD